MTLCLSKISASAVAIALIGGLTPASAAVIDNPPEVGDAHWNYVASAGQQTSLSTSVSAPPASGDRTIPANGATQNSPLVSAAYGSSQASAGGAPYAFTRAEASVTQLNSGASAYSTLTYQWLFYNPTGIVTSAGAPVVTISGLTNVTTPNPQSKGFAAINVAGAFYFGNGIEVDDSAPDTLDNGYREVLHGCGISASDICGEAPFTIRAMYTFVDDFQIIGHVQLRSTMTVSSYAPFTGNANIPTQSGSAFIDPIISFNEAFLASNPGGQLYLSSGIANASLLNAGVPENGTWAMMIAGLGAVGAAMRRRRITVSFA